MYSEFGVSESFIQDCLESGIACIDDDEVSSISYVYPSGAEFWIPQVPDNVIPYVNKSFSTLIEGEEFYNEYASIAGFSVRLGTQKYYKDGTIILKHFYCNKQGHTITTPYNSLEVDKPSKKRRSSTIGRTGCLARMILRFDAETGYKVFKFVEKHNHPLATLEGRQFLKSNRRLNFAHQALIANCSRANQGATKAYKICKELVNGYANIGANLNDFKNFKRDLKAFIGQSDAHMILQIFERKQEHSSGFSFDYAVDSEGCLSRLFWVDHIGKMNYSAFGDVVSFDATYGTNK